MFEVIEKLAKETEPTEVDTAVTPDVDNTLDLAAIVQRIERLEQAVAELSAKSEEKIDGEKTEVVEEKNESEENEE